MDDTIEICAGCGKMPRVLDRAAGNFICSRCGGNTTIQVNSDNYEKIVLELDQNFHMNEQHEKIEAAADSVVDLTPKTRVTKRKAVKITKSTTARKPKMKKSSTKTKKSRKR